jgi:hypothetical protein
MEAWLQGHGLKDKMLKALVGICSDEFIESPDVLRSLQEQDKLHKVFTHAGLLLSIEKALQADAEEAKLEEQDEPSPIIVVNSAPKPNVGIAEQSAEMGSDHGWKYTLRKAIDETPLTSGLLEAARPMASVGLDMDMFTAVIDGERSSMKAKLTLHGLDLTKFLLDFAMSIYAYTLEVPSVYSIVNGQMFDPNRSEGPGGVSAGLRACLPYIKYLSVSLESLPEEFRFAGRCYRGIKWTFPSPQDHDPESYFHVGRQFFWYEFKSTSQAVSTMYQVSRHASWRACTHAITARRVARVHPSSTDPNSYDPALLCSPLLFFHPDPIHSFHPLPGTVLWKERPSQCVHHRR